MLSGSLVAIATPMLPGGALDLPGLCKLIDFHIANGTAGIVVVGTTGESPTVLRRALPADQDGGRARQRSHPGHRGYRLEFDHRGDRADRVRKK
jgi:hypothetical protein